MISDIHRTIVKGQEGTDDRRQLASGTRTLSSTEYALTTAQTQTRSAVLATDGHSILYLHLVSLVNRLPQRRGSVSDVAS
jgi:hypothetical protein